MTFKVGDKVVSNRSNRPAVVIAAEPDDHGFIVLRHTDVNQYSTRYPDDLTYAPRTLAEVDPGVACRATDGDTVYQDGAGLAYSVLGGYPAKRCSPASKINITEILGRVKTVIEGREG